MSRILRSALALAACAGLGAITPAVPAYAADENLKANRENSPKTALAPSTHGFIVANVSGDFPLKDRVNLRIDSDGVPHGEPYRDYWETSKGPILGENINPIERERWEAVRTGVFGELPIRERHVFLSGQSVGGEKVRVRIGFTAIGPGSGYPVANCEIIEGPMRCSVAEGRENGKVRFITLWPGRE